MDLGLWLMEGCHVIPQNPTVQLLMQKLNMKQSHQKKIRKVGKTGPRIPTKTKFENRLSDKGMVLHRRDGK